MFIVFLYLIYIKANFGLQRYTKMGESPNKLLFIIILRRHGLILRTATSACCAFGIFMTFSGKKKVSREQIGILVGANSEFARTKLGVCPE